MDANTVDTGAIRQLAVRTVKVSKADRILGLGAEVAFFALLSLPPALLAILGTVGYVAEALGPEAVERIREEVLGTASVFLTGDALQTFNEMITEILSEGRAGIISIATIVALWSASRATKTFMEAVEIAYGLPDLRSGFRRRVAAFGITMIGIVGAVIVIPLVVAGPQLGEALGGPLGVGDAFAAAWRVAYWPAVAILGILMLASFYHFATPKHSPWSRDLPGAVVAAALLIAGAAGLRIYVSVTMGADSVYGPLSAPIVLLLWLYVTSLAALVGAELNAEIERQWPSFAPDRSRQADDDETLAVDAERSQPPV